MAGGAVMREWWANVYPPDTPGDPGLAIQWPTREGARKACGSMRVLCRIHVRLKPEGAPRRYASAREREMWEHHSGPEWSEEQAEQLRRMAAQEKSVADYWNRISPIG